MTSASELPFAPGVLPLAEPDLDLDTRPNGNGAADSTRRRHRAAEDAPRREGPKPLTRKERKQLVRLRARKVKRVIRHVDPWSVLKVSLAFYACLFVIFMVAGALLWNLAAAAGTIHGIEGFIKEAGAFKTFSFEGAVIFRAAFLGGLVLVIAGSAFNVLLAVLFNLISDLVGGVRITVIEEETARPVVAPPVPREPRAR